MRGTRPSGISARSRSPWRRASSGRDDILADYYDLAGGAFVRNAEDEITVFKNGGGAHLDLMCARYILGAVQSD